jgi:hypothetical protein
MQAGFAAKQHRINIESTREAVTPYEQALQIKPGYVEAQDNLARVRQRAAFPHR